MQYLYGRQRDLFSQVYLDALATMWRAQLDRLAQWPPVVPDVPMLEAGSKPA